jgi:GAF domain-containing protein
MGYGDTMGTSARVAGPREHDRVELERLAEEQTALRRVATLVAGGAASTDVFAAVAQEVAGAMALPNTAVCRYDDDGTAMTILAVCGEHPETFEPGSRWPLDGPSMSAEVLRTGRPSRMEDYTDVPGSLAAEARTGGFNRVAGAPIIVDGRVWGVIATSSADEPLPDALEERLAEFTELVATAIANSQARDDVTRLADEQAALRRVATLVAQAAPPADVFEAVSAEIAWLVPAEGAALMRFETDGMVTALGGWTSVGGYVEVGTRYPMEGTVSGLVFETGRPERIDNYSEEPGEAAAAARELGFRSSVGAPITVEGRVWGVLVVVSKSDRPLPLDAERRLAGFAELVATAIANAESNEELARLAEEQAALRRVATLVAEGPTPNELFTAVRDEVAKMFGVPTTVMIRYDPDGMGTVLATSGVGWGPVGSRRAIEGPSLAAIVRTTGRAARIDDAVKTHGAIAATARKLGIRTAVGVPIAVDGAIWGLVAVGSPELDPLPEETEARLAKFTELLATAIANSQAREELTGLAEEQAALRRVATLVARGVPAPEILDAVAAEVKSLLGADWAAVHRCEPDGAVVVLSSYGDLTADIPIGARTMLGPESLIASVMCTSRSARIESYEEVPGPSAARARELGIRSAVGAPINVEGRAWGVMVATWTRQGTVPVIDAESRMAKFTELVGTAIANAESRAQLDASRARIVATADATRRRIERDLHDGAQQQLLSLALEVRAAQAAAPPELSEHRAELAHVAEGLTTVLDGLREIALGIHPAILAEGGLGPALKTLARRSPIPVELHVRVEERLPEPVEVATYYVVSEALTNAAKHAAASKVRVDVEVLSGVLRVVVGDDGIGGADPDGGSGLIGLKDRAEAMGGTIALESCRGAGTRLTAELPLEGRHP